MDPHSLKDAEHLGDVMRCLVSEWGDEHFRLLLPRKWENLADTKFIRSDFKFVTDNSIVIVVGSGNAVFQREFSLECSSCQPGSSLAAGA